MINHRSSDFKFTALRAGNALPYAYL